MYNSATALVRFGFEAVIAGAVVVRSLLPQPHNTWVPPEPDPSKDGRPRARITHNGVALHEKRLKSAA